MKFSMIGQGKGELLVQMTALIEVTTWEGFTVIAILHYLCKIIFDSIDTCK
jgi:hypothetical protein